MKTRLTKILNWTAWILLIPLIYVAPQSTIGATANLPADMGVERSEKELFQSSPETCPVDMISYWKLDEAVGPTYQDYFGTNNGVCTGNCPASTAGLINGAQLFSMDEITVPYTSVFNWDGDSDFSIELLVNIPAVYVGEKVFISRHSGVPAWWVGGGGTAAFALRDSTGVGAEIWGETTLNDGKWHHIVAVHDGNRHEIRLYMDGVLENSKLVTFLGNWRSTRGLGIGYHNVIYNPPGPSYHLDGKLDEIAIYQKALSLSEIQYHYNKSLQDQDYCEPVSLTVNAVGGGTVEISPNGPYVLGQVVTLTPHPDTGKIFFDWSGDLSGLDNPATIFMDSDKDITANFSDPTWYTLDINITGDGSVDVVPQPDPEGYLHGTLITLTANPGSDMIFYEWSGDISGFNNPISFYMDGDKTVTASFREPSAYHYTLTIAASGQGSISLDPPPGPQGYVHGTPVTLTAVPSPGWEFTGWSGDLTGKDNPTTITMFGNKVLTASFRELHTLTVETIGEGVVLLEPDQVAYLHGNWVTLSPVPEPGWLFTGWSGDLNGTADPASIRMDRNKAVTASFVKTTIVTEGSKIFLPFNLK